MFLAKQVLERSLEKALDRADLPLLRKRELRLTILRDWTTCCRDAVQQYKLSHEDAPPLPAAQDDDPDRPFIDWITGLFPDNETLKDFLAFLVNEFLPKLFQAIVALIVAIAAI